MLPWLDASVTRQKHRHGSISCISSITPKAWWIRFLSSGTFQVYDPNADTSSTETYLFSSPVWQSARVPFCSIYKIALAISHSGFKFTQMRHFSLVEFSNLIALVALTNMTKTTKIIRMIIKDKKWSKTKKSKIDTKLTKNDKNDQMTIEAQND